MSTQSAYHSKSGPAIGLADPATERDKLIAANYAFAAALKQALRSGKETPAGVLATVRPKRGKNGWLCKRAVALRVEGYLRGWPFPFRV